MTCRRGENSGFHCGMGGDPRGEPRSGARGAPPSAPVTAMPGRAVIIAAFAILLAAVSASARPGMTPAEAIAIQSGITEGEVTTSMYYAIVADRSGIFDVSLEAEKGEVDLAVTHFSGSPSAESRREGFATDEVALRAEAGDRFLIRISSPLRVRSTFRLIVSLSGGEASVAEPSAPDVYVPESGKNGLSARDAVSLALGKLIPVEALGERFFQVEVPGGFLAEITVYPVFGDVDIEAQLESGGIRRSVISRRRGNLVEQVYVPVGGAGVVTVRATPTTGDGMKDEVSRLRRYALVVRLRHFGLTENQTEAPNDLAALRYLFPRESLGTGVPSSVMGPAPDEPSQAEKTILRLR